MFQTRSLILVASLGIAAAFAVVGSPQLASADAGCDAIKNKEVQNFCKNKGGVAAVKKQMKASMDAWNTANKDKPQLACKNCHQDQDKYTPKPDADFAPLKSTFCANAADCAEKK